MFLTAKQVARLTDDQVLELAGGFGPAIIGADLFERAQKVQKVNPTGAFGPAIIGAAATQLEEKDDDLEDFDDDEAEADYRDNEEDEDDLEARENREQEDLARMRGEDRAFDRAIEAELKADDLPELHPPAAPLVLDGPVDAGFSGAPPLQVVKTPKPKGPAAKAAARRGKGK